MLPVTFSYGGKRLPVGHALVDTGADITLLPREIAQVLDIRLDDDEPLRISRAGGGDFIAYPSLEKVGYAIEKRGFRSICWEGTRSSNGPDDPCRTSAGRRLAGRASSTTRMNSDCE